MTINRLEILKRLIYTISKRNKVIKQVNRKAWQYMYRTGGVYIIRRNTKPVGPCFQQEIRRQRMDDYNREKCKKVCDAAQKEKIMDKMQLIRRPVAPPAPGSSYGLPVE